MTIAELKVQCKQALILRIEPPIRRWEQRPTAIRKRQLIVFTAIALLLGQGFLFVQWKFFRSVGTKVNRNRSSHVHKKVDTLTATVQKPFQKLAQSVYSVDSLSHKKK